MLTLQQLKNMEPDTVFASGEGLIEHPWFNNATPISEDGNLEPDGRSTKVHWVAIRGRYHDWAIYHSLDANLDHSDYLNGQSHLAVPDTLIASHGAKLHNETKIKEFVPCDDEAFAMYRY